VNATDREPLRTGAVVRLVATREITERLRAKSYYILTGLLMAIILAIGIASRVAGGDGPDSLDVGVTAIDDSVAKEFTGVLSGVAELAGRASEVTTFADDASARTALEDGDVDVVVDGGTRQAIFSDTVDDATFSIVAQAWSTIELVSNLTEAGLTEDRAAAVLSTAPLAAVTLDGSDGLNSALALGLGTLSAVLLLISLQTFGGYVLTGVVEEKSSAVVELLLVRVRSDQLLAGKIIGIGATGLLQFALAVAAGVGSLAISGVSIPGEVWSAWPMTLVWFIGGFAFYSTLFALAGSLVSRQEDAQAASAPVMSMMIAAYATVFIFGFDTGSTASTLLSMVPPIAPLLMPMRMAAGDASAVEVITALVLLALGTVGVWKLTGRVFEHALLQRGARISWNRALVIAGLRRAEPDPSSDS
jgi:ABC-2 type transport system permease protein